MSAVPAEVSAESSGRVTWRRLVRLQARIPLLQLCLLAAVFAYGAIDLGFWNWGSVKQILVLASLAGLASVGQTLLILMGGFDLSISGFIVASALVVSVLKEKWNVPFIVAILIAVGVLYAKFREQAGSGNLWGRLTFCRLFSPGRFCWLRHSFHRLWGCF
jgi:ribose transport system permease protein